MRSLIRYLSSSFLAPARPRSRWLLTAGFLLLAARTIVLLLPRLRLGEGLEGAVLLNNKLTGWLHVGSLAGYWSVGRALWGVFWEWLPAALFGLGLYFWLKDCPPALAARDRARAGGRLPWLVAGGLTVLAAGISLLTFGGIPHVQDSIAQHFQAQIFAGGRPFAAVPPRGEFFPDEFLIQDAGRWYAQYPPMQALLGAAGLLAGLPWLVCPVLAGLSAALFYAAMRRAYAPRTALVALLFFALSPFVWFMSGERMNHVGTLFFVCAALWALAPALARCPTPLPFWRVTLGCLALGLAISTRPLCGLMVAIPLLAAAAWPARGSVDGRSMLRGALAGCLGLAAGLAPLLLFNLATTGSALRSGYEVQWGGSGWGFGQSQWGTPHTLTRGVQHAVANWDAAGRYLWEWPIPCLLPLLGVLLIRRRTRMDYALLGSLAALTLGYLPYFFQDLCLGPRFLYAGVPAFALLAARGLLAVGPAWARLRAIPARAGSGMLLRAAALCSAAGLAVNLPVLFTWYGRGFWGTSTAIVREVREHGIDNAVVFIRDYNRERVQALRFRGVSMRVAHGAVEALDDRWLDRQMSRLDAEGLSPDERGAKLERLLTLAMLDPNHLWRRRRPAGRDYQGFSSNYQCGSLANTPELSRQPVIYALHLGAWNQRLLREFPGRRAWVWDYDRKRKQFRLTLARPEPGGTALLPSEGARIVR